MRRPRRCWPRAPRCSGCTCPPAGAGMSTPRSAASGVPRSTLRRAVLAELAMVLGFGAVIGVAAGLAAVVLALRSVPEFVTTPAAPPLSYVPSAGPLAVLLGGGRRAARRRGGGGERGADPRGQPGPAAGDADMTSGTGVSEAGISEPGPAGAAMVRCEGLVQVYGAPGAGGDRAARGGPRRGRGRDAGPARPVRRGQVHPAVAVRRPAAADRRPGRGVRPAAHRPDRAGPRPSCGCATSAW